MTQRIIHGGLKPKLLPRILSGQAGAWAAPIRGALSLGEIVYAGIIAARNRRYNAPASIRSVRVPVISVGNITVGGTGKTPLVIDLAQRLERKGLSPAVVARGYGSANGEPGDEELLIRKHCPGAAYVADADRFHGAEAAVLEMGADAIVLDDGFQHRRLKRDLDIVLVDALCPFGYGHVLPRGMLREPLDGLARAHLCAITRCDQVSRTELQHIEATIRLHNADAPILHARHTTLGIEYLDGTPLKVADDKKRVLAFAGVGRPEAFVSTLSSLGFDVVAGRWWPDHYRYRAAQVLRLLSDPRNPPYDFALTTEKDAVKLALLPEIDPCSIGVVRIGVEFVDDGETALDRALEEALSRHPIRPVQDVARRCG